MTTPTPPDDTGQRDESGSRSATPRWLLRRSLLGVLTLFVVSLLIFGATQVLPSDAAGVIAGRGASDERIDQIRANLGLDESLPRQYWSWVSGVLTGDPGDSLVAGRPITELIGSSIVNSALLLLLAGLVTIPLAIVIGVYTAMHREGKVDRASTASTLFVNAIPDFVVGLALVVLFGTTILPILPPVSLIPPGDSPLAHPRELVLPVLTVVLVTAPYLARLVRGSMIDALDSPYVEAARLRGASERRIAIGHALPNALPPFIQGAALVLAVFAGEIVVIEYLFNYPGIGRTLAEAVNNRDVPMIQAVALLLAGFYVIVNLTADLLTLLASPRRRTAVR